ncbi:MAG: biotin/lipoyl-containing protein [Bacteriovoracaceae bacterium]|nr:acetyl-CoA carboxylase biotin carboxyl carrier protein subunit [Bacteroidota bacterium]
MNKNTIYISDQTLYLDESQGILTNSEGIPISADVKKISEGEYSVLIEGRSIHLFLSRLKDTTTATVNNFIFEIQRETLRDALTKKLQKESGTTNSSMTVRAPMPGLITKILRPEGSEVHHGEGILVIEAMKMENEIKSPRSGIVKKIFIKEKQTTEKNDHLFTIE